MKDRIRAVVREKLGDGVQLEFPERIWRDVVLMGLEGKARAVIGMRRSGKTYYLFQCLGEHLAAGVDRERLVYFNFEDERLAGMEAEDLTMIVDEYYRAYPEHRAALRVVWCFDEIQVVSGWETFIRRLLDSENVEIFLSGSSARLLSREVATSMRGRAMETVVHPYSFREYLRARGLEPSPEKRLFSGAERSRLLAEWDGFLEAGGFPEALKATSVRERTELLQSYVDVVILRDVGERYGVGNLQALRAFVRHLLRHPARALSISRLYGDFQSCGVAVSKGTLLDFLTYLEDAFLVFTIPLASRSARKQQVNPRKLYLADHGLAVAHAALPGEDRGWRIENAVAVQLARTCRDIAYVRTESGFEVDFLATGFDGKRQLIQVAADISSKETFDRETRALMEASNRHRNADLLLLAETGPPPHSPIPDKIRIVPVWQWLLQTA